jgi:competence protein ComEA
VQSANQAKDVAASKASDLSENVQKTGGLAADKAAGAKDATMSATQNGAQQGKSLLQSVGDTLWGVKDSLVGKANTAATTAQEQATQAKTSAADAVQQTADAAAAKSNEAK